MQASKHEKESNRGVESRRRWLRGDRPCNGAAPLNKRNFPFNFLRQTLISLQTCPLLHPPPPPPIIINCAEWGFFFPNLPPPAGS